MMIMSNRKDKLCIHFQRFLWGASTSAYQVEGGWDQDGKEPSVQDIRAPFPNTTDFKVSVDHYNRYKEDIQLFKELGLKTSFLDCMDTNFTLWQSE